ncbi:MAG: MBL fold metallo-hydrolase [Azoarcus sp.]|jgi:glyoxylase-like metal-dependent hydrolase (beta-lactamase superfamily II)|nr:MBL fold metallo-hydrolase [Azoarcus sp.]
MKNPFRPQLLLSVFAAVLVCAPTSAALAAPPAPAGVQVPGFYRVPVGDLEVVALYDGHTGIPEGFLNGMNPDSIRALLDRAYSPIGRPHARNPMDRSMQTAVNAFLVQSGQHLVLIDAGAATCFGPMLGHVQNNIKAAGYRLEDVDTVLLTHLHSDHVCGLLSGTGTAAFPNATVWAAKDEAAYWLSEEIAAKAPEKAQGGFKRARDAVAPYVARGKFKTWAAGETLLPGLTTVPSPGHTPGHSGYLFVSKGQSLLFWGDIVHSHAVQFAHPEVSIEFDADQKMAVATRRKIFADAARNRLLIAGAHLPFPGIGHVRAEKQGYQWVPVEFDQTFTGE